MKKKKCGSNETVPLRVSLTIPKPFVKWAGGKTQLLPTIEKFLPKEFKSQDWTYIEPFIGGGALLFYLLRRYENIKRAVINDINPHLINAYKAIKKNPEELIKVLYDLQSGYYHLEGLEQRKEYFLKIREEFNRGDIDRVTDAGYMMFLNRTCFNGLYRENSKGEFNVSFGRYENPNICDAELIRADSQLLQRVEIINGDYSQVMKYVGDNIFIYLDSPYRPIKSDSFTAYSRMNFNDAEQCRLRDFVSFVSERGCRILLSNSDGRVADGSNDYLDRLYEDYIVERVEARRSISRDGGGRGKVTEMLVRNYRECKG